MPCPHCGSSWIREQVQKTSQGYLAEGFLERGFAFSHKAVRGRETTPASGYLVSC